MYCKTQTSPSPERPRGSDPCFYYFSAGLLRCTLSRVDPLTLTNARTISSSYDTRLHITKFPGLRGHRNHDLISDLGHFKRSDSDFVATRYERKRSNRTQATCA